MTGVTATNSSPAKWFQNCFPPPCIPISIFSFNNVLSVAQHRNTRLSRSQRFLLGPILSMISTLFLRNHVVFVICMANGSIIPMSLSCHFHGDESSQKFFGVQHVFFQAGMFFMWQLSLSHANVALVTFHVEGQEMGSPAREPPEVFHWPVNPVLHYAEPWADCTVTTLICCICNQCLCSPVQ